jgi:chemotaxis protein methyltransferase CheR
MSFEDDFAFLRRLLKERSGLALSADKQYLVTTRLKPIIAAEGVGTLSELVARMKAAQGGPIVEQVVDAMTTNESLFFRDRQPFDALVEGMLPALAPTRAGRPLRIWSAAASTGQEAYSIAMMLEEFAARFSGLQVEIVATDISQAALKRARLGEYTEFEVGRGMPPSFLARYFRRNERHHYVILPKLRERVKFDARNLLEPFNGLGTFDIVFCRNVLIYFDRPTKTNVLERIARLMPADGFLVLGGPETTLGLTKAFARHPTWRNVYVRTGEGTQAYAGERACA